MRIISFIAGAVLFGVGLAADAFSVSLANGLAEPCMRRGRMFAIAGVFGAFQTVMPLAGWLIVSRLAEAFETLRKFIPWTALIMLVFIGLGMIKEGAENGAVCPQSGIGPAGLLLQGLATSVDALSVGLTISQLSWKAALAEASIIGALTFLLCLGGLAIGRRFGVKLAGKSQIAGGLILILIGMRIFLAA